MAGAEAVVVAVPVQHIRAALAGARGEARAAVRIGAAKGIERSTLLRVSEVLVDIWGPGPYAVLSGPSFAAEVVRGEPTAVTLAAADPGLGRSLQEALSTATFRVYRSEDVTGVEYAGALKNVIAIAAGMVRGLGFGSNTLAALLTRGLAEIRRLGVAMGGRPETFSGLAGIGDLVVTTTGTLSRNLRVGEDVAAGRRLATVLEGSRTVAEGVETARSAAELASRKGIEMPITSEVVEVLFGGLDPRQAVARLMRRDLKEE
jgi:glycerol-3-phosphate dehydrogenase (NAD(P)+)